MYNGLWRMKNERDDKKRQKRGGKTLEDYEDETSKDADACKPSENKSPTTTDMFEYTCIYLHDMVSGKDIKYET